MSLLFIKYSWLALDFRVKITAKTVAAAEIVRFAQVVEVKEGDLELTLSFMRASAVPK